MRSPRTYFDVLARQRGHLFPWVAVFFAIGVGEYFQLRSEPGQGEYLTLGFVFLGLMFGIWRGGAAIRPFLIAPLVIVLGFVTAGFHARTTGAPVLTFRYYGPVEGRVIAMDRSLSNRVRLTLDQVVLERVSPARTPEKVRVSLHGDQGFISPEPGMTVVMSAHLSPPQGPAEPAGFDFRRHAWFDQLGAVGYTRSPVLRLGPTEVSGFWLRVSALRNRLSTWVQAEIGGEEGAFSAAIMTGDRSGISRQTLKDLRASNLAHLLAISGLHMGLLTAFIFGAVRYGLALLPGIALRYPTKKIAAIVAIIVASGYLILSGGNVASIRAYIMVTTMLVAVLFDGRALTLHAVGFAALIVLLIKPESLIGPGFQMSFAATAALVAVFGMMRDWDGWQLPRPLRPVVAVVVSSFVAGAATAPIGAAHFNQMAQYGLLANLLSVPLMGSIVVPAAVAAVLLTPLGFGWLGFAVMGAGVRWILGVSEWIAGLDGALYHIVMPQPLVLPLIALGGVFVVLWRGRGRWSGLVLLGVGLLLWQQSARPVVLIAESGGLIGVLGEQGRVLNKPRGDGFAAQSWLENDGDPASQETAAQRQGLDTEEGVTIFTIANQTLVHLKGRGATDKIEQYCQEDRWIIIAKRIETPPTGNCRLIDQNSLRETGSIALTLEGGEVSETRAVHVVGERLWAPAQR